MSQLNTVPLFDRILATNEQVTQTPGRELVRRVLEENTNNPPETRKPIEILDNACGSGVIHSELLAYQRQSPTTCEISRIVNADISPQMTDHVRRKLNNETQGTRTTETEILTFDQTSTPLPDSSFTHITNNFGIFFSPHDHAALRETLRLLKPCGTAGFTSWEGIAWFDNLAVPALRKYIPEIVDVLPDPLTVFPSKGWHDREVVRAKLVRAGFEDVRVEGFAFDLKVENVRFAEATAFLVRSMMKVAWAAEDYGRYEAKIEPAFLRYLEDAFPGGYWEGVMKALVTTGKKSAGI